MLLQNRKPPGVENEILRVRVKSYDKLYDSFSICIHSKVKYDGGMYWWRIDVAPVYPLHEGNFLGKSVRYFATLYLANVRRLTLKTNLCKTFCTI